MKNIILGGSGLIGSAIANELFNLGEEVLIIDRNKPINSSINHIQLDITKDSLQQIFEGASTIYHMIGALGTSELEFDRKSAIELNILTAIKVFDTAIQMKIPSIFYPSKPNVWLNTYTITKAATEKFIELYNKIEPINITSLRYFNVYGPNQHIYPIRKIIPTFAIQAMRGLPIQVFGSGNQTVDMIYVEDAAKLSIQAVKNGFKGIKDCGRGVAITVNQVAQDVNDYFNNKAGIKNIPMRIGETLDTHLVANIDYDFKFSEWLPTLHKTLAWYASLPNTAIEKAISYYGF